MSPSAYHAERSGTESEKDPQALLLTSSEYDDFVKRENRVSSGVAERCSCKKPSK